MTYGPPQSFYEPPDVVFECHGCGDVFPEIAGEHHPEGLICPECLVLEDEAEEENMNTDTTTPETEEEETRATVPTTLVEHRGRTTYWLPAITAVVLDELDRPGKGAVVWHGPEVYRSRRRAMKAAVWAWVDNAHLADEDEEAETDGEG